MKCPEPQALQPEALISRADARAAGIPLRTLLGRRYQKVFFDLYIDSAVAITPAIRAQAALRACSKGAYASHFTSAELWGGVVPQQPFTHVSVPEGTRSIRRGIRAHVAPVNCRIAMRHGIPLSTPTQTFLELSPLLPLTDLVVLGDSLVRKDRTDVEGLKAAAAEFQGRGARMARRAAYLVREGVDSPMESLSRLLLVLAGLPEPVVNYIVRTPDGSVRMRFDLCYPDYKLIIEYDGRQHALNSAQWARDIRRREELDRMGWRIIILRAEDIYQFPDEALQRVIEVLHARGASGLPRAIRPEWRQHFARRAAAA